MKNSSKWGWSKVMKALKLRFRRCIFLLELFIENENSRMNYQVKMCFFFTWHLAASYTIVCESVGMPSNLLFTFLSTFTFSDEDWQQDETQKRSYDIRIPSLERHVQEQAWGAQTASHTPLPHSGLFCSQIWEVLIWSLSGIPAQELQKITT